VKALFTDPAVPRALDRRALAQIFADRLEDFMVPRHIEIRAELPRSAHGKIAKAELVQA
jgi:acyl-coenzyme A synthetase/AMP-(fatty) acid ligase